MRQFLAAAILGAVLAVTASVAFADERSGGVYADERRPGISLSTQMFWKMPGNTVADHRVYDIK